MCPDLTIGIAGSGGDGVILLGELLAKAAARAGLHVTLSKSFGPQIRGGETSARLRVADRPLPGADHRLDVLLLFELDVLARFGTELPLVAETAVFLDAGDETDLSDAPEQFRGAVRIPLEQLALTGARTKLAKNMVLAGVVLEHFGWPAQELLDMLARRFERYKPDVAASNARAVEAGRQWARENLGRSAQALDWTPAEPRHFLSGNEALSLGAIAGGCRFMAGYPISPASEILEWMDRWLPRFGGTCVQAEDEIAAVCMAIGAGYGGVRAMTATSGPGFTLMQEALGLAGMAEVPLVVANAQRCGPSTGIPTRTEQADLSIALHGSHGDAPRVVLAATSVADCYELTWRAFEIAERFQLPVVVLTDQHLAQGQQTVDDLEIAPQHDSSVTDQPYGLPVPAAQPESAPGLLAEPGAYRRYELTDSGVSPRSVPGIPGGEYVAVGIEHDESGDPTSSPVMHQAQSAKRARKLEGVAAEYPLVRAVGCAEAKLGLLTWGSSYGVCAEAARLLTGWGLPTQALAPQLLAPLPTARLGEWIASLERLIVVELNFSGQLYRHLRAWLDLPEGTLQLNRAGGAPLGLTEVLGFVKAEVLEAAPSAAYEGRAAAESNGFNTDGLEAVLSGRAVTD